MYCSIECLKLRWLLNNYALAPYYTYMYTHPHIYIHTYRNTCICTHMYTHNTHTNEHTLTCMQMCVRTCTHTHVQHLLHTIQTCTRTHLRFLRLCSLNLSIKGRDHSDGPVQEPLHILLAAVGRGLNSVPLPPLSSLHSIDEPQFMGVNCAQLYGLCIHTMQNKQYYMVQLLTV